MLNSENNSHRCKYLCAYVVESKVKPKLQLAVVRKSVYFVACDSHCYKVSITHLFKCLDEGLLDEIDIRTTTQ